MPPPPAVVSSPSRATAHACSRRHPLAALQAAGAAAIVVGDRAACNLSFRSSAPAPFVASRRRILRAAARAQFWTPREVTHIARTARARRTRLWWSLNKRRARSRLLCRAGARTRAGGSGRRRGTQRSAPPLKSTATRCAAAGASAQRVWWLPTTRGRLLHSATLSITKVAAAGTSGQRVASMEIRSRSRACDVESRGDESERLEPHAIGAIAHDRCTFTSSRLYAATRRRASRCAEHHRSRCTACSFSSCRRCGCS